MPYDSKRKYAPKKALIKRKTYSRPKRLLVNRALHPIPQRYITKMKYADFVLTDTNGQYQFNLNSIWDPNRTGVGHQPYGFDTLASLYNRYRVISCGWRIQATGVGGQATAPVQIAAIPANEVLLFANVSEIRENPRAKYIVQNPGAEAVVLSGKSYIPSLVGRNKAQYMADDRYQSLVTTSPNELAVLNIVGATTFADTPAANIQFNIVLEYTVEFFDIKHLTQS